ncbi:ATP-binding protein [Vibrio salinus]|uniref:ATP-binding protein n=1 Tax=Vibrio salinus TaxID=2899784 RepID=UPI001E2B9867|nr:ATP-binding protein [Vibrio salinus]MCE0495751.1 ATP-binding protein [Vibrio salinus]
MTIMQEIRARAAQGNLKYSWDDLKRLREQDEAKQHDQFRAQLANYRISKLIGRSGILAMYQGCSIENYLVTNSSQHEAVSFASQYITNFDTNAGTGFIFSGNTGTGKNHLAAAICNALLKRKYSCLIITVTELMQKLRACYGSGSQISEDQFVKSMADFDLLVIDEIGLQRNTDTEKLMLNQIIDQRVCRYRPTGMLTNLPYQSNDGQQSISDLLGPRIMDRMKSNSGVWLSFNWESFRK